MKDDMKQINDADLHRFVDGELDQKRSNIIADCIAADSALQQKVAAYREINRKLGEIYSDSEAAQIPARLLLAVSNQKAGQVWRFAASILWILVGGIVGYSLQGINKPTDYQRPLPVEAAYAHTVYVPEVRHPVEVGADQSAHMNAWLSKRLDRPVAAPDLRTVGYTLVGGRLLPDGHRAAAQFMFEDGSGKRLTLFIRQAGKRADSSFLYAYSDELNITYWVDNHLAYALTSSMERSAMMQLAEVVYQQAEVLNRE